MELFQAVDSVHMRKNTQRHDQTVDKYFRLRHLFAERFFKDQNFVFAAVRK